MHVCLDVPCKCHCREKHFNQLQVRSKEKRQQEPASLEDGVVGFALLNVAKAESSGIPEKVLPRHAATNFGTYVVPL